MLHLLFNFSTTASQVFFASLIALIVSFILYARCSKFLPTDRGRAFAAQGLVSVGKPTGAGIFLISVFIISSALFIHLSLLNVFFLSIIFLAMFFGYLDDRAQTPWHEYIKGGLDLVISVATALVFASTTGTHIILPLFSMTVVLPYPLFVILATILVWAAINVTNCTDGVDGLSGSMAIVSIVSFIALSILLSTQSDFLYFQLVLVFCLLAYLWFNANPSKILMGDAGSRALGVAMAISALYTRSPLSYLIICLLFILDGGAGIVKISLKRFLKIHILKNVKTPLHDHFRESGSNNETSIGKKWKNQTLTARFLILHISICAIYILAIYIVY